MTGRLVAIAKRTGVREPMQLIACGDITCGAGLDGDHKGARFPRRQITVLALEDWHAAIAELGLDIERAPWTIRRANLLVEGLRLPRAKGALIRIGAVTLEVTGQTHPCQRMQEALPGLMKVLAREWQGGITARVIVGGQVRNQDAAEIVLAMPEHMPRLP